MSVGLFLLSFQNISVEDKVKVVDAVAFIQAQLRPMAILLFPRIRVKSILRAISLFNALMVFDFYLA